MMLHRKTLTLGCTALLGLTLFLIACRRENSCNTPIGETNFSVQPNSAMYPGLNNVGGYQYFVGGHRGIVVIRTYVDEFVAYERTCPLDTNTQLWVSDSLGSAVLECPKCGSKFSSYTDGVPLKGSATSCSLWEYTTSFNGTDLYIY